MGWRNDFYWNGFSLGFLIIARVDWTRCMMTQAYMDAYGTSLTFLSPAITTALLSAATKMPNAQKYIQFVGNSIGEKLRLLRYQLRLGELNFGYDVPVHRWVNWMQGLNVSFIGVTSSSSTRKLLSILSLPALPPMGMSGMDYFMLPSMRQLGFLS